MINNPFQAQVDQAALSSYLSDAQQKALLGTYNTTGLRYLNQQPTMGALNLGVTATTPTGAIGQGISNGINNAFQLGNYRRQNQAYMNVMKEDQALRQQQRDMLVQQANQKAMNIQRQSAYLHQNNPKLADLYDVSAPDQQDKLWEGLQAPNVDISFTTPKAVAGQEAAAAAAETQRQAVIKNTGVDPWNVQGPINASARNYINAIGGKAPEDIGDDVKRASDRVKAKNEALDSNIKTQYLPEEKAAALRASNLSNLLSEIKVKTEPLEVANRLNESYQRQQISKQAFEQGQQALAIWDTIQENAAQGRMPSQQELLLFTNGMKALKGQIPELDKDFNTIMGLKADEKISDDKWTKFWADFSPPVAPKPKAQPTVINLPASTNVPAYGPQPGNTIADFKKKKRLEFEQQQLANVGSQAGKAKKEAQAKVAQSDKTLSQAKELQAGYDTTSQDAKDLMKEIDALQKKYNLKLD